MGAVRAGGRTILYEEPSTGLDPANPRRTGVLVL
jgi:hypothetical protein